MTFVPDPGPNPARGPTPPRVLPVYPMPAYPPPSGSSLGRVLLVLFLIASISLNIFLICGGVFLRSWGSSDPAGAAPRGRDLSGAARAAAKNAGIRVQSPNGEGP